MDVKGWLVGDLNLDRLTGAVRVWGFLVWDIFFNEDG